MPNLFGWIGNPAPLSIDYPTWVAFQLTLTSLVAGLTLSGAGITLLVYVIAARRRRIVAPGDVFLPYRPLWALMVAPVMGVTVAILCFAQLNPIVDSITSKAGISAEAFAVTTILSAVIAYVLIVLMPGLTPARFRYRPAWYLYRSKTRSHD
jgi:hypothetical protein